MQVDQSATRQHHQNAIPTELPISGFDAVTFYVGNARQASYFYNKLFGFDVVAYRGPETGCRDTVSYVLKQNRITFVLTSALDSDHPVARHAQRHGDGVKDIAFQVDDVEAVFELAVSRGAKPIHPPEVLSDEQGRVVRATIGAYGDTTHTFVNRHPYPGIFEPGYAMLHLPARSAGLSAVDHIVANVEEGRMEDWVAYYQNVFGFYVLRHFDQQDISTKYSALVSKVMANRSGTVKLPINEPSEGLRKSQIQEFLDFYGSAGVQHLAISTSNIIETVKCLRDNGIGLMHVPQNYYDAISTRVGDIREALHELAELGILIDREDEGYLLQIFTQPLQDRPTLFFEIIQRQGAEGFGKGNFKALFEAIEHDQARRGNL